VHQAACHAYDSEDEDEDEDDMLSALLSSAPLCRWRMPLEMLVLDEEDEEDDEDTCHVLVVVGG
jgi:hypothetical protein